MRFRAVVLVALALLAPRAATAQLTAQTLNIGALRYQFHSTGYAPALTLRFTYDVAPGFRIEPSLGYILNTHINSSVDPINGPAVATSTRGFFPEMSFTFHGRGIRWIPYASVGLGAAVQRSSIIPRSVTVLGRAGIERRFETVGLVFSSQFRSFSWRGYTMEAAAGLVVHYGDPTEAERKKAIFKPTPPGQRFAIATGLALPTNSSFGVFPTVRAEWYPTDPDRRLGLVVDAHVSRALTSPANAMPLDHRGEYGFALSAIPQLLPGRTFSPYLLWGLRWRRPWEITAPRVYPPGMSPEQRDAMEANRSQIEPNLGAGAKLRLPSGQDLRLEIHYYQGLNYFPVTVGFSF